MIISVLFLYVLIDNVVAIYGQPFTIKAKEGENQIIGFGGNNPDERINATTNGSIPNVGEINNFNSTSKGFKVLVTISNISKLLTLDNTIVSNLYLKIEDHDSIYSESDHLEYKFKKLDFHPISSVSNNKTFMFLFNPGLIKDNQVFKVCIYYSKEYNVNLLCKEGNNSPKNKQETIGLNIPKIINLEKIFLKFNAINSSSNDSDNNNKSIYPNNNLLQIREINISDFESIDLRYVESDKYQKLKFAAPLNKMLSIDNVDDVGSVYLTQINGSNINNYTEDRLSGNNVLHINGFKFNEKDGKIYGFGDYHYLNGSHYDVQYGLATEYHDHSIFVIDPIKSNIINSIILWGGEEEGDETTIGNTFINPNSNEVFATAINEGDLDGIYVIDLPTLEIKSFVSIRDSIDEYLDDEVSYDEVNDILYACNQDSIIGIDINNLAKMEKNISSIYCPKFVNSDTQIGYFMNYPDDSSGFIDLTTESISFLFNGGNLTDIDIISDNTNTNNDIALLLAHTTDRFEHSCKPNDDKKQDSISYVIKINIHTETIMSVYEFNDVFIDQIIRDPVNRNFYALTNELISDPYSCSQFSKMYNLGAMFG